MSLLLHPKPHRPVRRLNECVMGDAGIIQPTLVNVGTAPDKRLINPAKCWDLFWRPEFAVEPAHRFRLHWVRLGLSVLDKAALCASQRPVFEAESPRRNVLDLHAASTLWTAGSHRIARREAVIDLRVRHGALLFNQAGAQHSH